MLRMRRRILRWKHQNQKTPSNQCQLRVYRDQSESRLKNVSNFIVSTLVVSRNSNVKKKSKKLAKKVSIKVSKNQKRQVAAKVRDGEYVLDDFTPCGERSDQSDLWTHYKRVYHKEKNDKEPKVLVTVNNGGAIDTSFICCKYCRKIYCFSGSTINALKHVEKNCSQCV